MFDTVCIVGVGLIGGSFGIALRERKLAKKVVGAVRREATINAAFQRKAIDNGSTDLIRAARGADLIFLASPVGQMKALSEELVPGVKADAIVTDAGSTKAGVVEECAAIFGQKAHFIGGHPMAGSELTGVENARGDLFENAVWILTPAADTPPDAVEKLKALVSALGATPLVMDAATHDNLLAVTSHLPHLTAAALVHLFSGAYQEHEIAQNLIAGGWRDSTRIAAGSPEMWRDICVANSSSIGKSLDALLEDLHELRTMIEEKDGEKLHEWFQSASEVRRKQGYFPRQS
jgi:prephenate dehydrogenase